MTEGPNFMGWDDDDDDDDVDDDDDDDDDQGRKTLGRNGEDDDNPWILTMKLKPRT